MMRADKKHSQLIRICICSSNWLVILVLLTRYDKQALLATGKL